MWMLISVGFRIETKIACVIRSDRRRMMVMSVTRSVSCLVRPDFWPGRRCDQANPWSASRTSQALTGAKNVPSWARGEPRRVGETPTQFAERLMDRQFGGRGNWDRTPADRGAKSAFSQILKSARGWRNPRAVPLPPDAKESVQ